MTNRAFLTLVLILGSLSAFGPMSIDMYLPAFPAMARGLNASPALIAYTLSAFFIGLSLGQLVYGPLADRWGRKPPLLAGLVLYAVASVGCALAPTAAWLIAMRALQALGACAGMVIGRAMVRDLFDATTAARVFSLLMLVMGVAPIVAPSLGGFVLQVADWRGIFWCLLAFGLSCLLVVVVGLPESLPPEKRVKLSLGAIASEFGRLLRDGPFMGYALTGSLSQAGMFAYIVGSPHVFITLYGVPASHFGLYFGANAVGLIGASQVNAWLLKTHSPFSLLTRALTASSLLGLVLMASAATGVGGFWALLAILFLFLAMLGFVVPNAMALALGTQTRSLGQASALMGTVQFGAATLAGTLMGSLQNQTALPFGAVVGTFAVLGGCAFLLVRRAEGRAAWV